MIIVTVFGPKIHLLILKSPDRVILSLSDTLACPNNVSVRGRPLTKLYGLRSEEDLISFPFFNYVWVWLSFQTVPNNIAESVEVFS